MKKAILIAALMTAPATAPAMAQTCFDVDGFCEVDTSRTVDRSVTNKNRNDNRTIDRSVTNRVRNTDNRDIDRSVTNNYYGSSSPITPLSSPAPTSTVQSADSSAPSVTTGDNSTAQTTSQTNNTSFIDLPETAVAPLPTNDTYGEIDGVKVPLPSISVGTFASRRPYDEVEGLTTNSGDYDFGVTGGFNIPLGTGKFHRAANNALRMQELQIRLLELQIKQVEG